MRAKASTTPPAISQASRMTVPTQPGRSDCSPVRLTGNDDGESPSAAAPLPVAWVCVIVPPVGFGLVTDVSESGSEWGNSHVWPSAPRAVSVSAGTGAEPPGTEGEPGDPGAVGPGTVGPGAVG